MRDGDFPTRHNVVTRGIYIGTANAPRSLLIPKELPPSEKEAMIKLLHDYKDVFAWSHEDIEGLDLKFY